MSGTGLDLWTRIAAVDDPRARRVEALSERIREHALWPRLRSPRAVRIFMEHHVWAVWDFMSLLKSIQAEVAPVSVPWVPAQDPEAARFIHEIVADEEGDEAPDGSLVSHFETYLAAMDDVGADARPVRAFVHQVADGRAWQEALESAVKAPREARAFARATLEMCQAPLPERVAAFTLGREDIIPAMFTAVLRALPVDSGLGRFLWYLERHVAVDGDRHGPLAARLFARVCLRDPDTTHASLVAGVRALQRRDSLWTAVATAVAESGEVGTDRAPSAVRYSVAS